MGQTRPLFVYFFSFHKTNTYSTNLSINDNSVDGELGTRTWGGEMVTADESTELWRHPAHRCYLFFGGKLRLNDKFSAIPAIN